MVPVSTPRLLSDALYYAGQARLSIAKVLARHGYNGEVPIPDLSTKEKAQKYIGLDMGKLRQQKKEFLDTIVPKWIETARKNKRFITLKNMWKQPYTYKEGSVISIGLLVTGGLLQVAVGPLDWIVFMWPGNILALAFLLILLAVFYALRSHVYFFRFMTTVQAAVPALATAAVLTVVMGLTRQAPEEKPAADVLGLTKMLAQLLAVYPRLSVEYDDRR